MSAYITSANYKLNNHPVQGSFKIKRSQNVSISDTNNFSSPTQSEIVIISSVDYYKLNINSAADPTSTILPPGFTTLIVDRGDVLNFIRVGATSFELSIIEPE